jgi:hypothetical protein
MHYYCVAGPAALQRSASATGLDPQQRCASHRGSPAPPVSGGSAAATLEVQHADGIGRTFSVNSFDHVPAPRLAVASQAPGSGLRTPDSGLRTPDSGLRASGGVPRGQVAASASDQGRWRRLTAWGQYPVVQPSGPDKGRHAPTISEYDSGRDIRAVHVFAACMEHTGDGAGEPRSGCAALNGVAPALHRRVRRICPRRKGPATGKAGFPEARRLVHIWGNVGTREQWMEYAQRHEGIRGEPLSGD